MTDAGHMYTIDEPDADIEIARFIAGTASCA